MALTLQGGEDLIFALDKLEQIGNEDNKKVQKAAAESWGLISNQMKLNAASYVRTGNLVGSIMAHSGKSKNDRGGYIFAEAGVLKDDQLMISVGLDPKHSINAAQAAYWLEFGTEPHHIQGGNSTSKSRWRRADDKGNQLSFNEESKRGFNLSRAGSMSKGKIRSQTGGVEATFFLSRAYDSTYSAAVEDFDNRFTVIFDEAMK